MIEIDQDDKAASIENIIDAVGPDIDLIHANFGGYGTVMEDENDIVTDLDVLMKDEAVCERTADIGSRAVDAFLISKWLWTGCSVFMKFWDKKVRSAGSWMWYNRCKYVSV